MQPSPRYSISSMHHQCMTTGGCPDLLSPNALHTMQKPHTSWDIVCLNAVVWGALLFPTDRASRCRRQVAHLICKCSCQHTGCWLVEACKVSSSSFQYCSAQPYLAVQVHAGAALVSLQQQRVRDLSSSQSTVMQRLQGACCHDVILAATCQLALCLNADPFCIGPHVQRVNDCCCKLPDALYDQGYLVEPMCTSVRWR